MGASRRVEDESRVWRRQTWSKYCVYVFFYFHIYMKLVEIVLRRRTKESEREVVNLVRLYCMQIWKMA
jgi:hypothetical protein